MAQSSLSVTTIKCITTHRAALPSRPKPNCGSTRLPRATQFSCCLLITDKRSFPPSASSSAERSQEIITEIKHTFRYESNRALSTMDFTAPLNMLDSLHTLGISRHFENEVTEFLNFVFRCWKKNKGEPISDLSTAALAFKMLRLYGYADITPDALSRFRDHKTSGFCGLDINSVTGLRSALNLLRLSMVRLPEETILEEAESLTLTLLKKWLSTPQSAHPWPSHLVEEVKYRLECPWYMSPPRWEARRFIEIFGNNHEWSAQEVNKKILELAKLDFNTVQKAHQQEFQKLCTWWNESSVSKLRMFRQRAVGTYFGMALAIWEPQFADVRVTLAKAYTIVFMLDDLYDEHATLQQLRILTDAFRRWDISMADSLPLPHEVKTMFRFSMEIFAEFIQQCNNKKGSDTEPFIREAWLGLLESFMREAEWEAGAKELPETEEYLRNGSETAALWPLFIIADFLLSDSFPKTSQGIGNVSAFHRACARTARVLNDIYGSEFESQFQGRREERNRKGESVSMIECLMKENPGLSRAAALEKSREIANRLLWNLIKLYLQEDEETGNDRKRKRVAWEITRLFPFLYKGKRGNELMSQLHHILLEPFPI